MNDDVAVILHHPATGLVTLDADSGFALGSHAGIDLFSKVVDVPPAGSGGENEVVVKGSDAPHVQDNDLASFVVQGNSGAQKGMLNGDLGTRGRLTTHRCNLQRASFGGCDLRPEVRACIRCIANWWIFSFAVGHLQAGSRTSKPTHR